MNHMDLYRLYKEAKDSIAEPDQSIVDAIVELNSYVRSASFRENLNTYRISRSIYAYKEAMLVWFIARQRAGVRYVVSVATCRDCGGSGSYIDSWGQPHDHCWQCGSSGQAKLYFFETTLTSGLTLHTPVRSAPREMYDAIPTYDRADLMSRVKLDQSAIPSEWQPNQPGHDLTPSQAAELLNRVEDWFWGERFPSVYQRETAHSWDRTDMFAYFDYRLYVGRTPRQCVFCGSTDGHYYHHQSDVLDWFDYRCKACGDATNFTGGESALESLTQPASIQQWLAKRTLFSTIGQAATEPVEF
jgi:hypothetical protein